MGIRLSTPVAIIVRARRHRRPLAFEVFMPSLPLLRPFDGSSVNTGTQPKVRHERHGEAPPRYGAQPWPHSFDQTAREKASSLPTARPPVHWETRGVTRFVTGWSPSRAATTATYPRTGGRSAGSPSARGPVTRSERVHVFLLGAVSHATISNRIARVHVHLPPLVAGQREASGIRKVVGDRGEGDFALVAPRCGDHFHVREVSPRRAGDIGDVGVVTSAGQHAVTEVHGRALLAARMFVGEGGRRHHQRCHEDEPGYHRGCLHDALLSVPDSLVRLSGYSRLRISRTPTG